MKILSDATSFHQFPSILTDATNGEKGRDDRALLRSRLWPVHLQVRSPPHPDHHLDIDPDPQADPDVAPHSSNSILE